MRKIKRALIPAAGLGTRFLPITKAVPKPMLPVIDKPTVQYIAEELTGAGIEEIIIVVSPGSDVIEKHFGAADALEERLLADGKTELYKLALATRCYNVKFAVQEVPNGLAGAVLCAEKFIGSEPFALLLGDELIDADGRKPCIKQLIEIYERTGKSVVATMEVFGDDVEKYGNIGISGEDGGVMQVSSVIEKPSLNDALSNYAVIGRYVLDGGVTENIKKLKPHGNEICFTDVLDRLAGEGKLLASCFDGERYDVGDKFGYVRANVELALKSKELGEKTAELIKELYYKLK